MVKIENERVLLTLKWNAYCSAMKDRRRQRKIDNTNTSRLLDSRALKYANFTFDVQWLGAVPWREVLSATIIRNA